MEAIARRNVMKGSAALAVAAIATPVAPKAASAPNASLPELLRRHRAALRAYSRALNKLSDIKWGHLGTGRPPVSLTEEQEEALRAKAHALAPAETEARVEIVMYAPRNPSEVKLKANYIDKSTPFRDGWCYDEDFLDALLKRACEVRS
jgi:hypothetical protein